MRLGVKRIDIPAQQKGENQFLRCEPTTEDNRRRRHPQHRFEPDTGTERRDSAAGLALEYFGGNLEIDSDVWDEDQYY